MIVSWNSTCGNLFDKLINKLINSASLCNMPWFYWERWYIVVINTRVAELEKLSKTGNGSGKLPFIKFWVFLSHENFLFVKWKKTPQNLQLLVVSCVGVFCFYQMYQSRMQRKIKEFYLKGTEIVHVEKRKPCLDVHLIESCDLRNTINSVEIVQINFQDNPDCASGLKKKLTMQTMQGQLKEIRSTGSHDCQDVRIRS